jgi:HK97 family phage major capsid protein
MADLDTRKKDNEELKKIINSCVLPGPEQNKMYIRAMAAGHNVPDEVVEKFIRGAEREDVKNFTARIRRDYPAQHRDHTTIITRENKIENRSKATMPTRDIEEKTNDKDPKNILAAAEQFKIPLSVARKFIEEDRTFGEFRDYVMQTISTPRVADNSPELPTYGGPGLVGRDLRNYSLTRMIRNIIEGKRGIEHEVSEQMARDLRREPRGLLVPNEIFQRGLTVGSSTSAGNLVGSTTMGSEIVNALYENLVCQKAGARILSGLQGNGSVTIPRQDGSMTAQWITEGNAATETVITTSTITLEPHTVSARTSFSRQLLLQSAVPLEQFLVSDLAAVIAREIDRAAINGTGTGGEPRGILKTSGISTVGTSPAAPSYSLLMDLFEALAAESAAKGALAYVANAATMVTLMKAFTNSTYGEVPIIGGLDKDGAGVVANLGIKFYPTELIPATFGSSTGATTGVSTLTALILADWSQLVIGQWSGLDLIVDPYGSATTGAVNLIAFQDIDVGLRQLKSFAACSEVS